MPTCRCHNCGRLGHYVAICPELPPREAGASNESGAAGGGSVSKSGLQLIQSHVSLALTSLINPNWVLLDSESTVNVFRNRRLLTDVMEHPLKECLRVYSTGGSQDSYMVGKFGGLRVWYNHKSLANILSLALVMNSFRVTLDSSVAKCLSVWVTDTSSVKFVQSDNGLFYYDASDYALTKKLFQCDNSTISNKVKLNYANTQTVAENEKLF